VIDLTKVNIFNNFHVNGKMSKDKEMKEVKKMKVELRQLLETCIETGSEADLNSLVHLLEGFQRKINKNHSTYIDGILQMERKLDETTCEITIPLHPTLNNNLNILHGGITATVLDTTMGSLANYLLPKGFGAVTNQLNIHYIAPGIGETLRCKAEVVHKGTKTMVISGEAFRSDGRKIAYATGTFFTISK
jgi:uncharacterized protein (TIGR00369 family)